MRPLELELSRFRSYDHGLVDWRTHELVVIAGDTGAGKSSLLDAMAFALYGKTPEDGTTTSDLVSLGSDNGEVRFTFQMDGSVWRATRRFGKKAPQPRHLLERLEADGGEPAEAFDGESEVNARLVRILGLGYQAFTSTVLLAQGQFARFFASAPSDRDGILREIFAMPSLEGVRQAATALATVARGRSEALGAEAQSAGVAWKMTDRASRELRVARTRVATLARVAPAATQVSQWVANAQTARAALERLQAARAALPTANEAETLAAEVAARASDVEQAHAAASHARAAFASAFATREDAEYRHGGATGQLSAARAEAQQLADIAATLPGREADLVQQRTDATNALRDIEQRESALRAELARATSLQEEATAIGAYLAAAAELAAATAAHEAGVAEARLHREAEAALEQRLQEAELARRDAERADHVAHIRSGIRTGDLCPVCGNAVATLVESAPILGPDVEQLRLPLTDVQRAVAAADAATAHANQRIASGLVHVRATEALTPVSPDTATRTMVDQRQTEARAILATIEPQGAAIAEARGALNRVQGTHIEIEQQITRDRERLTQGVGGLRSVPELTLAIDELAGLAAAEQSMATRERTSQEILSEALRRQQQLEQDQVGRIRQAVAVAGDRLGSAYLAPDASAADTLLAAGIVGGHIDREVAVQRSTEVAALDAATRGQAMVASAGIADPEAVPQMQAAAERAAENAARDLSGLREKAAQARRLREGAETEAIEHARYQSVADDLKANQFPRFLLNAAREQLAAAASLRLQDLSAGAYRFAAEEPDPLAIVDVRRDATRSVATLSGGERFLASLALALALGDIAAGAGGRLDCLFLDEGFSTLDSESLELAVAGIERLAGRGRLIGVITHLPGMAERLGAAIRVAKDPAGVSRIMDGG